MSNSSLLRARIQKRVKLRFRPHLVDDLRGYNGKRFLADLSAGVTVGIVALPLAMAFGIASGVKPEAGIFTAIVAGFMISALGGSRVQIGGPAGAFIVVVYGIIERYGLANLLISTMMAGVLLFAMGVLRLGNIIRYMPVAVVIGFTNGIAVLIALSQVKNFFGLDIDRMPADFFRQLARLWEYRGTADWQTFALGAASLAILFLWPKAGAKPVKREPLAAPARKSSEASGQFGLNGAVGSETPTEAAVAAAATATATPMKRLRVGLATVPAPIFVLAVGTAMVSLLGLPVQTIGSQFGGIPEALPALTIPAFDWDTVKQLFAPTITIALLCAIESLLCARVADALTGERHDPNQELMGQGLANLVTPLFGGIPATGTIARTVTNVRSGAATPIAGIVHALTLLAIVLAAAPLASGIPLACLAALLIHVAWNMGEWHEFRRLHRFALSYRTILVATFLLTIVFDLTVAVEAGIVLACVFFILRMAQVTRVEPLAATISGKASAEPDGGFARPLPAGIEVYRVFGSLFFGAVSKLEPLIDPLRAPPRVLVLELGQLIQIDSSGLDALETLYLKLRQHGSDLVLCGVNEQPATLLLRSGFIEQIGPDRVCADLDEALTRAEALAASGDEGDGGGRQKG